MSGLGQFALGKWTHAHTINLQIQNLPNITKFLSLQLILKPPRIRDKEMRGKLFARAHSEEQRKPFLQFIDTWRPMFS